MEIEIVFVHYVRRATQIAKQKKNAANEASERIKKNELISNFQPAKEAIIKHIDRV